MLGGWLTDSYSWRWVFYINIPVGIASLVMTKMFIFDPPYLAARSGKIDYWGIGMLAVGIGALQIVLDKGQEDDWFSSNVDHDARDHQRGHARRAHHATSCTPTIRWSICACSRRAATPSACS